MPLTNSLSNRATYVSPFSGRYWSVGVPIRNIADYSPFGVALDGRTVSHDNYRYGFQNQEEDSETGLVNYKYRMHDPRVGRFFAVDPLASKYPWNSVYAFSENRVLDGVELEGLEFLNSEDARIYMKNGQLFLRPSHYMDINGNCKNQALSRMHSKGGNFIIDGRPYVGAISVSNFAINVNYTNEGAIGPSGAKATSHQPSERTTEQESNDRQPRRKDGNWDNRRTFASPIPSVRMASRLTLAIEIAYQLFQTYSAIQTLMEDAEIGKQVSIEAFKTLQVLQLAAKDGNIPEKYANQSSIDELFNVILYGGENNTNAELKQYGLALFDYYTRPDIIETSKPKDYNLLESNGAQKADNTFVSPMKSGQKITKITRGAGISKKRKN